MRKKIFMFYLMLFSACSIKDNNNETLLKESEMGTCNLYPDSLTEIQKKCIEKKQAYLFDPNHEDSSYSVWDAEGYMTSDEIDAIVELSFWDMKKRYKPVDDSIFSRRFKEVFGYNFNDYSRFLDWNGDSPNSIRGKKHTHNLISFLPIDAYRQFFISKKERVIIDIFDFGFYFEDPHDVTSFLPYSRSEDIILGTTKQIKVHRLDYLYHLNNYLFNEANVSRTWLINNDKYFMSHLLIQYGYDGDNEINKMVLKKNRDNDVEIIDMPVAAFHVYPDGKVKILNGLLKSAAELSTADCADYFEWATSIVDRFNASAFYKEAPSDDYDHSNPLEVEYHRYSQKIHNLTTSQRREIIAHVVNYMLPVYEKYIDGNMSYGTQSLDYGDLRIIDCFWNAITFDHDLIAEIEKNNYYGLPNLESLISSMKNFQPFYNEETNEFEPWEYVPMRYRQQDEEEKQ